MLPKVCGEVKIKEWTPKFIDPPNCYLYNFKAMGITNTQFAEILIGQEAIIFETPFVDKLRGVRCAWCEFNARKDRPPGTAFYYRNFKMQDHIYSHNKNIVDYQVNKFQAQLYTMRLQFVRRGFHAAIPFLVEHTCQICIDPVQDGREGMCAIPTSSRNRMRSLKALGYPIKHILKHRLYEWSCLGIIVQIKA